MACVVTGSFQDENTGFRDGVLKKSFAKTLEVAVGRIGLGGPDASKVFTDPMDKRFPGLRSLRLR